MGFEALGLRFNPFEVPSTLDRRPLTVPQADLDALIRFVAERPRRAVQFIGDKGRGKSTHLRAMHTSFASVPFSYVPEGVTPEIPSAPVVFVDESQRLPVSHRFRLFRRPASFVLATHRSHWMELAMCGVEVRTVRVSGLSRVELQDYVDRRVQWAAVETGAPFGVPDAVLSALHGAHGSDVRAIERALYHFVQDALDEEGCR